MTCVPIRAIDQRIRPNSTSPVIFSSSLISSFVYDIVQCRNMDDIEAECIERILILFDKQPSAEYCLD